MNRFLSLLISLVFVAGIFVQSNAQDEPVKSKRTLTHHMSPEEKALFHTVGKGYLATDPPPGVVHNIAEFEQMEGVLVGYPGNFGISYALIAAMSQEIPVTTIVETNNQLTFVTNQYQANGVNMANANFLVAPLDSYWTRDYGPWYIRYGNDQIGIMDFIYNRPNRPNDNAVPVQMANYLNIESFGMDLITAGGNYMTDGYGISSSSDLTWVENPSLTHAEIEQMLSDYCGIDTYHVLPDPNNTYIDHIDCWGKFLDVDKVLIREVPPSHPQYDEIEATANYYANEISSWGNNYQVYRVWTPNNEPYTNSLILNNRVFLPIMGGQWDDEAVEAYEEAMPGYEILTFTGSWESTDALHCRTKGIADRNTLYIEHYPLLGEQPIQPDYEIEAIITAYSGQNITADNVVVHYWINGAMQVPITMTYEGNKLYSATIPAGSAGSEMRYYISAEDDGGFTANHPFIGEPDPHVFYVGEQLFATISLDVTEINAWANQGYVDIEQFSISNTGGLELNYTLDWSSAILEDYDFSVDDSPAQFAWDNNTWTELGWTEMEVNGVVGEIASWTIDFTWNTDQYGDESTFYALSPNGTQTIIAAGIPDGNYTISLDAFNGELMQGTWRIWITDSYGDGGHQATDISVTITKTYEIFSWLTPDPTIGTVEPGNTEIIYVSCDGTLMPVGDYEGSITVSSNDPDFSEIVIPVNFHVDIASQVENGMKNNSFVHNYPNPFTSETNFELSIEEAGLVSLVIYDVGGRPVKTLMNENSSPGKRIIPWNGTNESGNQVSPGIYFYFFKTTDTERIQKIVRY